MKSLNETSSDKKIISSLSINTITGDVFIYPIGYDNKKFTLRRDEYGYFYKRNGYKQRILNNEDIERINKL